ncbi:MAG: hypothetical protein ACE5JD_17085, partial [Candidatus Methylomirabilia bacterium]
SVKGFFPLAQGMHDANPEQGGLDPGPTRCRGSDIVRRNKPIPERSSGMSDSRGRGVTTCATGACHEELAS